MKRIAVSKHLRGTVFVQCGGECHYCNHKFTNPCDATMDHLEPVSAGGRNKIENLVLCCKDVNNLLGATPREIRERYAAMKGVSWTCQDLRKILLAERRAKKALKRKAKVPSLEVRQEKRSISLLGVAASNRDDAGSEAAVLAIIEDSITELLDRFAIDGPAPDHSRRT